MAKRSSSNKKKDAEEGGVGSGRHKGIGYSIKKVYPAGATVGTTTARWKVSLPKSVAPDGGEFDTAGLAHTAAQSTIDKYFSKGHESQSGSANGQVLRSGAKEQQLKIKELNYAAIKEAEVDSTTGSKRYPVTIIQQGLGNKRDKNYYTAQAIKSAEKVYEGKKAFMDHPTEEEEEQNPNRTTKDLFGHYENVKAKPMPDGRMELSAYLVPVSGPSNQRAVDLLEHAIAYKKKYPDKHFVGLSINGDGAGKTLPWDEFLQVAAPTPGEMDKLQDIKGEDINVITELTDAVSADMVTEPGAGGGIKTKESNLKKRRKIMFEAMRRLLRGVEKNDKKVIESAVKSMLNSEGEDDAAKKEAADKAADEATAKEADTLVKHMLNSKKEVGKLEGEGEKEYESRCMAHAMKNMKKEASEAAEAAESEKKEGEGESENESEKKESLGDQKEGESEDDGDDDADDGAADDKKKKDKKEASEDDDSDDDSKDSKGSKKMPPGMKQMQAQIESLKKKIEGMEKKSTESENEAKEAQESAAEARVKLKLKEREGMIDRKLQESGLPRSVTTEFRPVLSKCKSEKEMDTLIEKMKNAASSVLEETFQVISHQGLVERAADASEDGSTDHFFAVKEN